LRQRRPPNTPSPWAAARSHATPVRPAA
jgi:hypothetical protein